MSQGILKEDRKMITTILQ